MIIRPCSFLRCISPAAKSGSGRAGARIVRFMVVALLGLGVPALLSLLSPLPDRSLRLPLWLTCRNERDLDRRLGGSGGGLLLLLLWSLDGDGVRRDASVDAAIASANALSETPECWGRSGLARTWGSGLGRGFW